MPFHNAALYHEDTPLNNSVFYFMFKKWFKKKSDSISAYEDHCKEEIERNTQFSNIVEKII